MDMTLESTATINHDYENEMTIETPADLIHMAIIAVVENEVGTEDQSERLLFRRLEIGISGG